MPHKANRLLGDNPGVPPLAHGPFPLGRGRLFPGPDCRAAGSGTVTLELAGAHPETAFGHWRVSNSERRYFSQDQGNQWITRRRTGVSRTRNPAD